MKNNSPLTHICLPIATRDGKFTAHYSKDGLAGLSFPTTVGRKRTDARQPDRRQNAEATSESSIPKGELHRWHTATERALKQSLAGGVPDQLPPLDLSSGTAFQQRVWKALQGIGPGKWKSYAEIAAAIGNPKAIRAVGGACGANPIPVLIPCHRVLASGGGLGGFSAGLEWKRILLKREGISVPLAR